MLCVESYNSCNQSSRFTPADEVSHACMCFTADLLIIERRFVLVCCTHFGVLYSPRFGVSPTPYPTFAMSNTSIVFLEFSN